MSKYIIDTGDYLFTTDGVLVVGFDCDNKPATFYNSLDNLEELNSDYINEHYGSLQDEAYQAGLNDAWEAARKIALMDTETSENVTGYFGLFRIMENLTAMQAIAKLKAYEDGKHSDRIEVGDEVDWDGDCFIVTKIFQPRNMKEQCDGIDDDGSVYHDILMEDLKKTGKHYDIQSILEAMRE